jgi:uncharacterized protein YbjT (DUF2867 family)
MSKILVTGPTGNVGKHVVSSLADIGRDVRALVRDTRNASLPEGVDVAHGDLSSPHTLVAALRDVDSVYLMWPGLAVEPRVVELIAEHARRVVYLSADVPDLADGEEPTIFHQEIERLIRQSPIELDARAGDRLRHQHPRQGRSDQTRGRASAVRAGVTDPRARRRGRRRPRAQLGRARGGRYLVTGPESITQAEIVGIIGEAIGRDVRWEGLPLEIARKQLTAASGDARFAEARLKAWASFVESPERVTDDVERLLGRPARTFRSWAQEHAADFR